MKINVNSHIKSKRHFRQCSLSLSLSLTHLFNTFSKRSALRGAIIRFFMSFSSFSRGAGFCFLLFAFFVFLFFCFFRAAKGA